MQHLNIGKVILVFVCTGRVKVIGSKIGNIELSSKSSSGCPDRFHVKALGKSKNSNLLSPVRGSMAGS